MESSKASVKEKTCYIIPTRVVSLEERKGKRYISGHGDATIYEEYSLGWFVVFEGSHEALGLGKDKPEFKVGDRIKITISKVLEE